MSKCLNCNKEVISTGNRERRFCDDKCRMAFNRSKTSPLECPTIDDNAPIRTNESEQNRSGQVNTNCSPTGSYSKNNVNKGLMSDFNSSKIDVSQNDSGNCQPRVSGDFSALLAQKQGCNNVEEKALMNDLPEPIISHNAGTPNRVSVPGDSDYVGVCYQDEQGNWQVDKQDTFSKEQLHPIGETSIINSQPSINANQAAVIAYNAAVRARLKSTHLSQLRANLEWIPGWRIEQGEKPIE